MADALNRRALLQAAGIAALPLAAATEAPPAVTLPEKVRVAILGLHGHFGEVLKAMAVCRQIEVVAIEVSSERERQRAAGRKEFAGARMYSDYRELLDEVKPGAVCVCDENHRRAETVTACLERRIPVAAEKPMALELADLEKIRQLQAETGTPLTMLLPMRFDGAYLAMKEIVGRGEIGEPIALAGQKSYQLGERPDWMKRRATFGGAIPYIACHVVDLLCFISGRDMVETAAFHSNVGFPQVGEMENNASISYRLDNRGTASVRLDYLRPEAAPSHGDDRVRIAGADGVIEHQGGELTLITDKKKPHTITERPQHTPLFADFLDAVFNGKTPALTTAEALRVTRIVLRSREAADTGKVLRI